MGADWDLRDKIMAGMAGLGTLAAVGVVTVLWNVNGTLGRMDEKQAATVERLTSLEASVKQSSTESVASTVSTTELIGKVLDRQNAMDALMVGLIKDVERLKERSKMPE